MAVLCPSTARRTAAALSNNSGAVTTADVRYGFLVGIEMKPPLPSRFSGPAIPGQAQRLVTAPGKGDEVLLQWVKAECMTYFEWLFLAVGILRLDDKLTVPAIKTGLIPVVVEDSIVEITQHAPLVCRQHSLEMVRDLPGLVLFGMARNTGITADIIDCPRTACEGHCHEWKRDQPQRAKNRRPELFQDCEPDEMKEAGSHCVSGLTPSSVSRTEYRHQIRQLVRARRLPRLP